MVYDNLIYEKKDSIGLVTINRPSANSWSLAAMEDFEKIQDYLTNEMGVLYERIDLDKFIYTKFAEEAGAT